MSDHENLWEGQVFESCSKSLRHLVKLVVSATLLGVEK